MNEEVDYCIRAVRACACSPPERLLWASKKIFNTARYFSSIVQLFIYQRINSFIELNSLCLEIRHLMRNGGNLFDALELAVTNVRSLVMSQIKNEQNQILLDKEIIDSLNKLIDKWYDS